jgi:hypothetical protein
MTTQQQAFLLMLLHTTQSDKRSQVLNSEILNFGLNENDLQIEREKVETYFDNGIKNLNSNQLNNLLITAQENQNEDAIVNKLNFYDVEEKYQKNILQFFIDYIQANKAVNVGNLDSQFKGVQVASRDDFNKVINQGWTGDWDLQPENINPKRIQIASMNESGPFPRGCYLNADIKDIQPIQHTDKIRYRIFIENPVVINTGNRNVKFNTNPVRYIR